MDEFSGWLSVAENRLNLQGPMSARHKLIMDQRDKLQVRNSSVGGTTTRDDKALVISVSHCFLMTFVNYHSSLFARQFCKE